MSKFISDFIESLKNYGRTPQIFAWLTVLILLTALFVINAFFLPLLLLILTAIILLGTIFLVMQSQIKLARLSVESSFKIKELNVLIDDLKDGVLVYDNNFKVISFNRTAENIFGLKAADLLGKNLEPKLIKEPRLKTLIQAVFPSLAPTVAQLSEGEWPEVVDISLEDPSLKLRTTLNRIADDRGKTVGFLKVFHDQTREENILQSKSEFIAIAAHQLRTPLTAIHWAFENLNQTETKPEAKETINEGLKLAERSLKIVNDLLDAAKIEEGRFGYHFEEMDLGEFVKQILEQLKSVAEEYHIKLYFSSEKNYKVRIDAEKLNIALSNLIDNAIKYNTKNGNVTVSLTELRDKPGVRIGVEDTGVGIPPEELKKLFMKFYRGTNITQIEPNGSGLGLYITKNIIEQHGGEIGVESILGRGSTFWFTLPLNQSATALNE